MQDCIGVTYTATQSTLELSAKVQDCTGVTYTATQSILGLFKLEVNYSSNCFSKSSRLHRSSYTATQSTLELSAKVQDCIGGHLYSNSINTGTIYVRGQLFIKLFQQKCKIA